ncbi:MAG: RHS repeat-associated core domain-containing protein [Patescibacteria group bacterium]
MTYAYDNNGNLTSDSTWTHSWNYANQLTQSQKTGSTVTYQYDHTGQRTKLVSGSVTTRYANKLYNSDGTKNSKHIYAGSQLVATVEGSTLQYIHTDHLTGSNVATNSTGGMVQLLDYYPYGSMRIDWKSGSFDEQRKFTGHMYDRDTSLTYANARYYKQNIGQFLRQDSVFLAVGLEKTQSSE